MPVHSEPMSCSLTRKRDLSKLGEEEPFGPPERKNEKERRADIRRDDPSRKGEDLGKRHK